MTIVKPCWANSASQYSARWTRIPAHSPYSPNMHRFHHNFLDPTTSPIITIILKEKMPPSPYTYIYVLQWCLHPHLKTQRTSGELDHFSKRLNSAVRQQRSFSHTLRTWTLRCPGFEFFTKMIKKVVRGFLGSGDEIVTLAVGTYNATKPLFLPSPACFDSLERKWKIVYGRAL